MLVFFSIFFFAPFPNVGKGEEEEEGGGAGSAGQQTRIAEINSLDSTSNPESPDPKAVMVSSTESLVTAATVATTSDQSEAAPVKAGPSGARVAGYDEEEIRMRAQMKAAALEQGSDDEEAVPPGGGMRPNAWVNKSVFLMGVLIDVQFDFPVLQEQDSKLNQLSGCR